MNACDAVKNTMGWLVSLKQDAQMLTQSMSRAGFWPCFLILFAVLAVVYASLTSIIYWTPFFGINPGIEAVRIVPIGLVVALTALLLTLQWLDWNTKTSKKQAAAPKAGLLGSIIAFFATGCALCQPIWLVWLGFGEASLFLIDWSIWISLVSIGLLLYALHIKLNESCKV